MPFLRNVTNGRGIPDERLATVAAQYEAHGGVSPINEQNEAFAVALADELSRQRGARLDVYVGNRNWDPYFADALMDMARDGVTHAAVVVTSGYASYSGCRQYRENLYDACEQLSATGTDVPKLTKIGRWSDQPGFLAVMADHVAAELRETSAANPTVLFTTHSLPITMAESSGDPLFGGNTYQAEHRRVAEQVAQLLQQRGIPIDWELVYQSRSGSPRIPWLEPDICDRMRELKDRGVGAVVAVPIGFQSDHMEVIWDLDVQAREVAQECGIEFRRAGTVGTDSRFVAAIARMVGDQETNLLNGGAPDRCPVGCCANPVGPRPALFGMDGTGD
jgi:ferrochelatase